MFVRRRRIVITAALAATALTAGVLTGTFSATAAAGPTDLPVGEYKLSADYHQFDPINSALASTLGVAPVHTVMDNANHDRKPMSGVDVPGLSDGFRFDKDDNEDCKSYPQGITTSRDAVGTANGGDYDGHQLVLVSWYTKDACKGKQERSRITLVDWDASHPNKYRKVLLVEPTGTADVPDFKDIPMHAGGVSWYGDYLYVADTGRGMRVFDMRQILKTNTGGAAGDIGRQPNGDYFAHNYAYVLPQIGNIASKTTSGTDLVWSTISLDRTDKSMVMTEYTCQDCDDYPKRAPRAIRFPFAAGANTFAASTTATQALKLPWYNLNGVGSHNKRWWFNSSGQKQLYYWTPSTGSKTYPFVSSGESMSYWEDATKPDLLWTLQEGVGNRNVFAVNQASYDG